MRRSGPTATSSSARTRGTLTRDLEDCAADGVHVLLATAGVVDAVVAHVGRVAWRHLEHPLRAAAHPAQLPAQAVHEDLGPVPGLLGRGLERVELRLGQLCG